MQRIMITGAGRGLGLEFVRQYLQRGDRVFATLRNPAAAKDLRILAETHPDQLTLVDLEATEDDSIAAAHRLVREHTDALDVLINNAGIFNKFKSSFGDRGSDPKFGNLTAENLLAVYHVNTVAPVMIVQRFVDLLAAGDAPKLVNMSSIVGSIGLKKAGGYYAYSGAKAALNMMTRVLAHDLAERGITVISLHPGWVQTDMGGARAPVTPKDSIAGMIGVIDGLQRGDSGRFLTYEGASMDW